jgi:hypothetical protein
MQGNAVTAVLPPATPPAEALTTVRILLRCAPHALPLQEAEKQRVLAERAAQQEEASGVLAEVAEITAQNQALNKTFMALAGVCCACVCVLCVCACAC